MDDYALWHRIQSGEPNYCGSDRAVSSYKILPWLNPRLFTAAPNIDEVAQIVRVLRSWVRALASHQVEVLSYADCFLFMALVGAIALFLIPLMSPVVLARQSNELKVGTVVRP